MISVNVTDNLPYSNRLLAHVGIKAFGPAGGPAEGYAVAVTEVTRGNPPLEGTVALLAVDAEPIDLVFQSLLATVGNRNAEAIGAWVRDVTERENPTQAGVLFSHGAMKTRQARLRSNAARDRALAGFRDMRERVENVVKTAEAMQAKYGSSEVMALQTALAQFVLAELDAAAAEGEVAP